MLSSFILFLIVGGITFNFYNSLSTMLKKICLISTTILLVIVIAFMISKKNKDFFK
jgi:cbb3-type cytochrome oxidase subunit 3